jgi:hypothetical protein
VRVVALLEVVQVLVEELPGFTESAEVAKGVHTSGGCPEGEEKDGGLVVFSENRG